MAEEKKDVIQTTVRLPVKFWKKLRNLQTEGKINSIHQVLLDGAMKLVKEIEK